MAPPCWVVGGRRHRQFQHHPRPATGGGEVLQVTATDAAGNTSTAGDITAPDIDGGDTTPPDAATNLVVGLAGAQLSGRGEAGASVQVRDAQGNVLANGTVNPDGTFQITLDPPVKDGSNLQVVLTDASGNASAPASVVTPTCRPRPNRPAWPGRRRDPERQRRARRDRAGTRCLATCSALAWSPKPAVSASPCRRPRPMAKSSTSV
jgi:hypothetical protein